MCEERLPETRTTDNCDYYWRPVAVLPDGACTVRSTLRVGSGESHRRELSGIRGCACSILLYAPAAALLILPSGYLDIIIQVIPSLGNPFVPDCYLNSHPPFMDARRT